MFIQSSITLLMKNMFQTFVVFSLAALSNVESVLSSSSAWLPKYKDVASTDDTRIPECAERFMTLLSVITGKFER